jgi:hypothetical protein
MPADQELYQSGSNQEDMMRYQMISQYQQNITNPQARYASNQMQQVMSANRFQYGVGENQPENRFYRRQAELKRSAFSSSLTGVVASQAAFELSSVGLTAAGIGGGFMGGMVAPALMAVAPMYFINKGIQNSLERQRVMQGMSADIEQYRSNIGMPNMSYGTANQLGNNLMGSAFNKGQFFNPQQQMDVLKTALSNDMLTSKGKGMATGDIQTFQKNFKELLSTTEMIVKTLKTTKEGGLAMIKEMQQQGYGTMGQVQTGVAKAQAYGNITGLGSQNLLQIGAAGAAAVQNTPWMASAGAGMYQTGTALAGIMARSGAKNNQTIQMAGGVAQAGATIANAQMNVLQSGMGSRVMAYVMNSKGELDTGRFNRLMRGGVSGYEVNMGAANTGHGLMMSGDRVLFERKKNELLNQMANSNPEFIGRATQATFQAWGANRRGSTAAQAQAFARQFAGGSDRVENLIADYIRAPKAYGLLSSELSAIRAGENQIAAPESGFTKGLKRAEWGLFGGLINAGGAAASGVSQSIYGVQTGIGGMGRAVKFAAINTTEMALSPLSPYGIWSRGSVGNVEKGYRNLYGMGAPVDERSVGAYSQMSRSQKDNVGRVNAIDINKKFGINVENIFQKSSGTDLQYLVQTLRTGIGNQRSSAIFTDTNVLETLGLKRFSPEVKEIMKNPSQAAFNVLGQVLSYGKTIKDKAGEASSEWEKYAASNAGRTGDLIMAQDTARLMSKDEKLRYYSKMSGVRSGDKLYGGFKGPLSQKQMDLQMAMSAESATQMGVKIGGTDWTQGDLQVDVASEKARAKAAVKSSMVSGGFFRGIDSTKWGYKNRQKHFTDVTGISTEDPLKQMTEWVEKLSTSGDTEFVELQRRGAIPKGIKEGQRAAYVDSQRKLLAKVINTQGAAEAKVESLGLINAYGIKNDAARDFIMNGTAIPASQMGAVRQEFKGINISGSDLNAAMSDPKLLRDKLRANSIGESPGDVNAKKLSNINAEIVRVTNLIVKDEGRSSIKYGYEGLGDKGDKLALKGTALEDLRDQRNQLVQANVQMSDRDAATGRSIDTMVHTPVLNYWANRWVM